LPTDPVSGAASGAVAFCSLAAAPSAIKTWRPDAVVSAFSPRWRVATLDDRPHLRLAFHDVERPRAARQPPRAEHIEAFVKFVEGKRHDRLLIHCRCGVSRAPALAIVAAILRGATPRAALERLAPFASLLRPNRLLLAFADRQLGLGGSLAAETTAAFAPAYAAHLGAELSAVVELSPQASDG